MSLSSDLTEHWRIYGRFPALFKSPYLRFAVIITIASWGIWSKPFWWTHILTVTPALFGFTLTGFAIFISMSNETLKEALVKTNYESYGNNISAYTFLTNIFTHIMLVQILALIIATISMGAWFYVPLPDMIEKILPYLNLCWGFLGYLIFNYSIFLLILLTFQIRMVSHTTETAILKNIKDKNIGL